MNDCRNDMRQYYEHRQTKKFFAGNSKPGTVY